MAKLIIPIGISGAGKSTFLAQNFPDATVIETDAIREELTGDASDQTVNKEVFRIAHKRTKAALLKGKDVAFDATNISAWSRKPLIDIAKSAGADIEAHVLLIPVKEAIKRQEQRKRKVPDYAIKRQAGKLEIPERSEIPKVHIHKLSELTQNSEKEARNQRLDDEEMER